MTLAPSRLRRRKILIIILLRGTDAQVNLVCCLQDIYNHATFNELPPAQQAVVTAMNDMYAVVDPNDDPDQFDACAYKGDVDTSGVETAVGEL
jgi:hypothetical protein